MKKISLLILLSVIFSSAFSQNRFNAYTLYIQKYSSIAIEQQKKHKIPASITLAQGLLESGAGTAPLAVKSNNHFGIKCHNNWQGEKVYHDDDALQECFRKYSAVKDSYEDHSQFLITRPRYSSLFQLSSTDYKGWANGLKKAGYATDPAYAAKLIRIIEDYELHRYDVGKSNDFIEKSAEKIKSIFSGKRNSTTLKEYPHDLFKNNGVLCVFSMAGDTYASIGDEYGVKEGKMLEYNDLAAPEKLNPGTVVYIKKKENKASKEFEQHVVQEGENMYRISQKYGIKLQSLYDLNNIPYTKGASVGQILKLR